jgi:hypothetical protein
MTQDPHTPADTRHLLTEPPVDRRTFLLEAAAGAAGLAAGAATRATADVPAGPSARALQALHDSLTEEQRQAVCFDWDYRALPAFGRTPLPAMQGQGVPLRGHVSNSWHITRPTLASPFYTPEQRLLVVDLLRAVFSPGWPEKLMRQAQDDTGKPWGQDQTLAFFGTPGKGPCQCVLTGFHLTARAYSGPEPQAAFGGPIAHGHQPSGFNEKVGHPGNIFWYQALLANKVYQFLDGRQQRRALLARGIPYYQYDGQIDRNLILPETVVPADRPREPDVRFHGPRGPFPGLPLADLSADQREAVQRVLDGLLEPYRPEYREQVLSCLKNQGGLEKCSLAFYQEYDLGDDGEWDNWRLEGPAFVWYFRGHPHVHIWVHVAGVPTGPFSAHFG